MVETLEWNLLFRWFAALSEDGPVWKLLTCRRNRPRLLWAANHMFHSIVAQTHTTRLPGDEHFRVDGTLI